MNIALHAYTYSLAVFLGSVNLTVLNLLDYSHVHCLRFKQIYMFLYSFRMEALNERRSGVVQMVKLAEKEKDTLEVSKKKKTAVLYFEMSHVCFP